MSLTPVPMTYRGVRFRSTLEADWAATLDELGIRWQYEPEAVQLPSGELYRCDFYLPQITTWLEVKGPLGERLHKTAELAEAVMHAPGCTGEETGNHPAWWQETGRGSMAEYICCDHGWWNPWQLVIIGEAPTCGEITSSACVSSGKRPGSWRNAARWPARVSRYPCTGRPAAERQRSRSAEYGSPSARP